MKGSTRMIRKKVMGFSVGQMEGATKDGGKEEFSMAKGLTLQLICLRKKVSGEKESESNGLQYRLTLKMKIIINMDKT
jgi:hypothetical protein